MVAREIALKVINQVTEKTAYANIALANELGRNELSEIDRRFVTELVYGTIKAGETLDWILGHYVNRPINKIPPVIRNILRMGIYQIFFLSKVPISATCNEAVKLAKKYGHIGTVKFVNAILRAAGRNPDKVVYPDVDQRPAEYLALKFFHPQWLIKRWIERIGLTGTMALCEYNNATPLLSLRTNTLKIDTQNLISVLREEGVACESSEWTPEGIVCSAFPSLNKLNSLREGLFQVQDESSMLVAHVLAPQPGELIIDACGAPGGKSTHIAALMGNRGKVISTDIHEHKLNLIQENSRRLGISIIETHCLDATTLDKQFAGQADRVLVDAPCSGLGVLRRKPDSRWRKSTKLISELSQLQLAILRSAAKCVKPGGILVYSTCTTEPEENQNVVEAFLAEHLEFEAQTTGEYLPKKRPDKFVQLWPHIDNLDGFFIARMQRAGR